MSFSFYEILNLNVQKPKVNKVPKTYNTFIFAYLILTCSQDFRWMFQKVSKFFPQVPDVVNPLNTTKTRKTLAVSSVSCCHFTAAWDGLQQD